MAPCKIWCGGPLKSIRIGSNLVEQFCRDSLDTTPTTNFYCPGVPINSIPPSTHDDTSPTQLRQMEAYQSLIGSIGLLSTANHSNLAPVHYFLSSYSGQPSLGHMRTTLYAPHNIHSNHDQEITFFVFGHGSHSHISISPTLQTLKPTLMPNFHLCLLITVIL